MIVDCCTVSPFHFYSLLKNLNLEDIKRIKCIHLIIGYRMSSGWKYLPNQFKNLHFEIMSEEDYSVLGRVTKVYTDYWIKSFIVASNNDIYLNWKKYNPCINLFFIFDKDKICNRNFFGIRNQKMGYEFLKNGQNYEFQNFELNSIRNEFNECFRRKVDINLYEIFQNVAAELGIKADNDDMKNTLEMFLESLSFELLDDGKLKISF